MRDMTKVLAAVVHAGWMAEEEILHDEARCKQECDTLCPELAINPVCWRSVEAYEDPVIAGQQCMYTVQEESPSQSLQCRCNGDLCGHDSAPGTEHVLCAVLCCACQLPR